MNTEFTAPLHLVDGCLVIDNSGMENGSTCPRQFEYSEMRKREPVGKRSALVFGGIIHKALEYRYKTGSVEITDEIQDGMIAEVRKGFVDYQPEFDDYRNFDNAVAAILHYRVCYPYEDFQIATLNGTPAVEVPFAVPLGSVPINAELLVSDKVNGVIVLERRFITDLPIVWKGKIDLITRREGRLYPMDHKTTSMAGPGFWKDFEVSHQTHGYAWAVEYITKEVVGTFVINCLGIRKPTKTGKALEFDRKGFPVYPETLQEWHRDTMHILQSLVLGAASGYMPKHTKWCVGKYGTCKYHEVCTMMPEYRLIALNSNMFQDKTWDPLHE